MPQSLSMNLVHLIYSTKNRDASLAPAIRPKLHAYQSGIFRECNSPAIVIGGTTDHVHALLRASDGATERRSDGGEERAIKVDQDPRAVVCGIRLAKRLRSVFRERVAGRSCATVY